jgi:hypothetical protein
MANWNPFQSASWRPQGQANQNSYYNPQSYYGGAPTYWNQQSGAPSNFWGGIRYSYLDQNPDAVFTMATSPYASGTDAFSSWVRNQYGQTQDAYKGALSMNPDLTYQQFLSDFGQQGFYNRFQQQAPSQRGVQLAPYGAGRVQWSAF